MKADKERQRRREADTPNYDHAGTHREGCEEVFLFGVERKNQATKTVEKGQKKPYQNGPVDLDLFVIPRRIRPSNGLFLRKVPIDDEFVGSTVDIGDP